MKVEFDVAIGHLTTFGIPTRAAALVTWADAADLRAVLADRSLPRPLKPIWAVSYTQLTLPTIIRV